MNFITYNNDGQVYKSIYSPIGPIDSVLKNIDYKVSPRVDIVRAKTIKKIAPKSATHKVTIFKLNSRVETIKAVKAKWKENARERARKAVYCDMRYQCIILNSDSAARRMFRRA